jgi:hypothetical protein
MHSGFLDVNTTPNREQVTKQISPHGRPYVDNGPADGRATH